VVIPIEKGSEGTEGTERKAMDELVDVVVKVPRSKIGTLYEFAGRLVAGEEMYQTKPQARDETGSVDWNERRLEDWTRGTHEELLADARRFYRLISPNAQRFLSYLLEADNATRTAEQVTKALGFEHPRQVAGAINTFGKRAPVVGRLQPFQAVYGQNGERIYEVQKPIAELFREAIREEDH
jgi:hypothetical protein